MSSIRSSRTTTSSTFKDVSSSRLQSLYSDFTRQKNSNPASYNANVEWWRRNLEIELWDGLADTPPSEDGSTGGSSGDRLILHANRTLLDNLRLEGVGKPIGLGAVIVCITLPL
jgi:charged multivesicular body protein 7